MKSRRIKISVLSGVIVTLLLCIVVGQKSLSKANTNCVLTRAEMLRTLGLCDCTGTYPNSSHCIDNECPGCYQGINKTGAELCGSSVTRGSGNSRDECDAEATPDGVCKELETTVQCTRMQLCDNTSAATNNMTCNSNGTCVGGGTQWCAECEPGMNIGNWEYIPNYECTWD